MMSTTIKKQQNAPSEWVALLKKFTTDKKEIKNILDMNMTVDELYEYVGMRFMVFGAEQNFQIDKIPIIWDMAVFDEFRQKDLEVADGIFQCKCGSKKVMSFSKQTRSGDESTTVFASCTVCKNKWIV